MKINLLRSEMKRKKQSHPKPKGMSSAWWSRLTVDGGWNVPLCIVLNLLHGNVHKKPWERYIKDDKIIHLQQAESITSSIKNTYW